MRCLERRRFPLSKLRLFASARSAGQRIVYDGRELVVEEVARRRRSAAIDLAFFSAGQQHLRTFCALARPAGRGRHRQFVPLPQATRRASHRARDHAALLGKHHRLIANPNCASIIAITRSGLSIR